MKIVSRHRCLWPRDRPHRRGPWISRRMRRQTRRPQAHRAPGPHRASERHGRRHFGQSRYGDAEHDYVHRADRPGRMPPSWPRPQYATANSSSPDVKQFANRILTSKSHITNELRDLATKLGITHADLPDHRSAAHIEYVAQ